MKSNYFHQYQYIANIQSWLYSKKLFYFLINGLSVHETPKTVGSHLLQCNKVFANASTPQLNMNIKQNYSSYEWVRLEDTNTQEDRKSKQISSKKQSKTTRCRAKSVKPWKAKIEILIYDSICVNQTQWNLSWTTAFL